jgi:tetratricopeptide (TPR) repeat protein
VAIFGNLFGQIFGDSAAELEAQGDYFAGVNNWRRATDEYRRALQRTNKNSIGYRRLAAKFDDARLKCFDVLVDEIHSHLDVREFTYAADQIALARGMTETDEQRERLDECERRLRGAGRSSVTAPRPAARVHDTEAAELDASADAAAAARIDVTRSVVERSAGAAERVSRAETGTRASAPLRPEQPSRSAASVAPPARPGRDPNADAMFQKLLASMSPAQVAHRQRLGPNYRDAVLAYARGEAPRAVELFKKVADEHANDSVVQYDLAAAFTAAGRSREALSVYLRLAERDPHDWQPWYQIALLQWSEGLRDRAIGTLEEGLRRHPRSGTLTAQWGVLLYKTNDKRAALEKFYDALQLDSFDDAGLYHVIANLHLELGDPEKARRGYLKALELNPQSIGTMLDYAEFLVDRRRDAPAAQAILETTFRTLRSTSGTRLQQAYRSYLPSTAHMLLGEREMALLAVTRALEENDQAWLEDTLETQRQAVLAV